MIVSGVCSSLGYLKRKEVDIKNGWIFVFGVVGGCLVGCFLSRYVRLD